MDDTFGEVNTENGLPQVEFERVLDAAIDAVWTLLTTEDGLKRWLAPSRVELRLGGTMNIDFGDGGVAGGEIIELIPGVAIEYHWRFSGEPDSIIRFELDVIDPDQTRLRLQHRLLPADQATGYAAGWHAHLDQLDAAAAGQDPIDWVGRYQVLLPDYRKRTA